MLFNSSFVKSVRDSILNIGSIAGILALLYTIFQSLRKRPKFKFEFASSYREFDQKEGKDYCKFVFTGTLKNQSLDPNSIDKIFLVVRKNKKKNSTFRFGYGGLKARNQSDNTEIKFPLMLSPREAVKLIIEFELIIDGNADRWLATDKEPIAPGSPHYLSKYEYELAFEDINENLYDQTGKLLNRKEIDLVDTLGNSIRDIDKGIYGPFIKHKINICTSRMIFRRRLFLQSLGLRK